MRRSALRPLLILILLAVGIGTAVVYGPYMVWRAYDARSWPTVEGVVTRAELVETRKSGDRAWRPEVEVRYAAQGRDHTTDSIWVGGARSFRDHARAQDVLARFPLGGQVPVSVNPDDPADSVLDTGDVWRAWLTVGFGLVLIAAGLLVIARRG